MKPLAITLGDPAGIGPEVVVSAVRELDAPVVLFGSRKSLETFPALPGHVTLVDIGDEAGVKIGEVSEAAGRIALRSIDAAVEAIEQERCSALVTAPIHKRAIELAGSLFPGHTELLGARAGKTRYGYEFAMYFDSPELRVVLLTVHEPLAVAIRMIDPDAIAALAKLMTHEYERLYRATPRIAVAGLNPHAGEEGKFGNEELVIAAGVETARASGLDVTGPHPADTVFLNARRGKHDVVMAMYHDQGLIPVKTLAFEQSVNVTIGLPFLRVSVDHGTAFDIAGKGLADAAPMRYAIEWAARHVFP